MSISEKTTAVEYIASSACREGLTIVLYKSIVCRVNNSGVFQNVPIDNGSTLYIDKGLRNLYGLVDNRFLITQILACFVS